ncbi:SNF2 helicase associated domain-containing protein [Brevibacillus agri]|uniref:DEAD/DEAH box helicase n=1 Tax=Brevibacillus agri TaxID=51101 RepID=UPI002E1F2720|nr:SNF2 helicase associated domain-containing protein [Brevibacillus agri]
MSFSISQQMIKEWCGRLSFERGKAFYRSQKVSIDHFQPEPARVRATVRAGSHDYRVMLELDEAGLVAACSCPTLHSYEQYCQHIAAALLAMRDLSADDLAPQASRGTRLPGADGSAASEAQLTQGIFDLFGKPRPHSIGTRKALFDQRALLELEIICKVIPYGFRKSVIGLELKLGPKRLYVVKNIREFLKRLESRQPTVFSAHFTYDPESHRFLPEQEAILQELIRVFQHEKLYRETAGYGYQEPKPVGTERTLILPPFAWDKLFDLLGQAPGVRVQQGERTYEQFQAQTGKVPLQFAFDAGERENEYRLTVDGLAELTVLEAYGFVLHGGVWMRQSADACKSLAQLKQMLEAHQREDIAVPQEKMESFMTRVVPGLMKLGSVQIAQAVADRIVQTQLQARLYLDRVRERLLAGLEFQYGDIVINPLAKETNGQQRRNDQILLRDGEREQRILELMDNSAFTRTEEGYYLEDEEAEFEFLHQTVSELEKWCKVYATTAVKLRLHSLHAPPKVKADVNERTNWLEVRFDIEGFPPSEIKQLLQALEEKRKYYRLPTGALLPLDTKEFEQINRFLDELGIRQAEWIGNGFALPAFRGLRLLDSSQPGKTVQLGKALRSFLENMRNPDNLDFHVPDTMQPVLRDYQKFGFQWLMTLAHYGFGGILADDMGLGKTVQSIAYILAKLPDIRREKQPVLIVSPASLLYNWRNELHKFAPELSVRVVDGSKEERNQARKEAGDADVWITSYPLLRRDYTEYAQRTFHTLILDEAQAFKNYATQTAQVVKRIFAKHRFALTGTPIENRLEELWSIFNVVFPQLFPGRKEFQDLPRDAIARRARPFLLRRLKTEVLRELPEKIESLQATELLPEQKKLYIAYLAQLQQEAAKHLHERTFDKNRIKILAGLTRLRQLCCHPGLFVEGYEGSSAKFEQLLEVLEECRSAGRRVLLFSQFTEMLSIIGRELGAYGVPFFYLDGNTPAARRIELCNRFNDGEGDLFLLSLKAGGTGLNLTGADTVILYDLWWNPAVEEQAADRAHRIGQKNVVQVIRLVAQGTVEEKMYELQQKKKHLIEEVIAPGEEAISSMSEDDIREILMIG